MVRGPPWWTAAHAGWIVAVLAVSLLVMSVWVGVTRRQAMLRALAITDPLTGIYNLRGFNLLGQQQWQLAQRRQLPLVLFYIDLNDFKQINDTYGHKTGDNALRGVAGLLRDCFRSTDVVGRLGGDEFAVTAFDVPPLTQASLQKRIDSAVDQFNRGGALPCPISLSIGVLACEPSMGPIEDLLSRADALMYEQKRRRKKGPDTSRTR